MSVLEQQEREQADAAPRAVPGRRSSGRRSREEVTARLRRLGVPAAVLQAAKVRELRQLTADLDRFSAFGYDAATQRRFLREPHPALHGLTPIELMAQPHGVRLVHDALRQTLRALVR
jgi:uncharacterized protein (DUF2384 family)